MSKRYGIVREPHGYEVVDTEPETSLVSLVVAVVHTVQEAESVRDLFEADALGAAAEVA